MRPASLPLISCRLTKKINVTKLMAHDSTRAAVPPAHPRAAITDGSASTPAPTMAVKLWKETCSMVALRSAVPARWALACSTVWWRRRRKESE